MYSVFNFLMHVILLFCGIRKYLDFAIFLKVLLVIFMFDSDMPSGAKA
jgi:hypothetical protein